MDAEQPVSAQHIKDGGPLACDESTSRSDPHGPDSSWWIPHISRHTFTLYIVLDGETAETAVTKVLAGILLALDKGDIAMLTLLDLSAAFDTVDHAILLRRLEVSYGLGGAVLSWFRSYLDGRTQFFRCGRLSSDPTPFICGVPQGSVLGPILFLPYTADVLRLIERHNLHPHGYADDTQVYGFCSPSSCWELREQVSACLDEVALWMRSNRLQLNTSKTEVLW